MSGPTEMQVHSIASGSSGNAMLVEAGGQGLLIDAGVPGRTLADALRRRGIHPGSLQAVLLTHEHEDHVKGAGLVSERLGAPVVANRATLQAACDRARLGATMELATGAETGVGVFQIRSFAISHDAADPVGYVVSVGAQSVFYATDVGRVDGSLREAMRGAGLCVVEANHDRDWLRCGPYPLVMKERIAGARGHLANDEAADLIAERLDTDGPTCVWLAHLSRVNNSPSLALRSVRSRAASLTRTPFMMDVALRDRPSLVWRPGGAVQLALL